MFEQVIIDRAEVETENGEFIVLESEHDNETEAAYFNGCETFTEQEYAMWEAQSARYDDWEHANELESYDVY